MASSDSSATDNYPAAPRKGGAGGGNLIEGLNNLTLLRQAGLMIGLAASVAIGFAVVLWSQGEDYRPLYASLDQLDSSEVMETLEQNDIDYKIEPSTGALLVPAETIHTARLKLAEVGIPSRGAPGFELMDEDQPLGTSQFMESTRYHRSLEGEMARTITSINSVRSARVHLAIPKRSVFVREPRNPSASVFVEVYAGRQVERDQVRAIVNLVASSISDLNPEAVTVVDQRGNMLSTDGDNEELLLAAKQHEYTRNVEDNLARRIRSILEPVVGGDKFRAEVSADIDFSTTERAEETFNPDQAALRSEQVLNEVQESADMVGGIPGALTNQPPGEAAAPEQIDPETGLPAGQERPRNTREEATRNFEIDRAISYTRGQTGEIRRLSAAVVLDDKEVTGPDGETVSEAWTEEELERLAILVRNAVGFSALRGDSVNVVNSAFAQREEAELAQMPDIAWWQEDWVQAYLRQGLAVLVILAIIFGLLRPVLKNLASAGERASDADEERALAALESTGLGGLEGGSGGESTLGLPGPGQGYEQQLNTVKGMVADDPGRVAQVVKSWVNSDE